MSRRGSACALFGMLALANGLPLSRNNPIASTSSCIEDAPMAALHANGDEAQSFCKEYIPWSDPFAAGASSTIVVGSATVTSTVVSTPIVVFTVAEDYVVSVTSTQVCTGATPPPIITNSATITSQAKATPASNPRHGGRDVQPPDYVASYQPEQISSACNCLSLKVAAAATATTAEVITTTVPVVTQMFTTVNSSFVVSYNRLQATHTAVAISCITE